MYYIPRHVREAGTRTVIDVGTAHGTAPLYRRFPNAELVLIDPLEEHLAAMREICSERRGTYHITALGASEASIEFRVDRAGLTRSSALHRTALTERASPDYETRTVRMQTLDTLMASLTVDDPIGLKIDTEGFELEVLRGAETTLARCHWVIAEVSVGARFEGSYKFHELIQHLTDRGFEVANILHVSRRKKVAKYCDVLFCRPELVTPGRSSPGSRH